MDELGVGAHGNDLGPEFFELLVLIGKRGKLRRANKSKVRRVEEKDGPLLRGFLGGEADLAEITTGRFVGIELEIVLVDEHHSSEEGRKRYFCDNPPIGWRRFLPRTLLFPERAYDDYVAVVLAERFFGSKR